MKSYCIPFPLSRRPPLSAVLLSLCLPLLRSSLLSLFPPLYSLEEKEGKERVGKWQLKRLDKTKKAELNWKRGRSWKGGGGEKEAFVPWAPRGVNKVGGGVENLPLGLSVLSPSLKVHSSNFCSTQMFISRAVGTEA